MQNVFFLNVFFTILVGISTAELREILILLFHIPVRGGQFMEFK